MQLDGIHHISAITGDAQANLAFYTGVLGLRLTAKTVNQDDPSVYHLFLRRTSARGRARTSPSSSIRGPVPGRAGGGMVHTIVSRVGSPASLDFWAARLAEHHVTVDRTEHSVRFADPEGLQHELVVPTSSDTALTAEHPEIPAEHRLQGVRGRPRVLSPSGGLRCRARAAHGSH